MILFLVCLTVQKKRDKTRSALHFTQASIFRVEPCSLDSKQVKLHFGHKMDNICCSVHVEYTFQVHKLCATSIQKCSSLYGQSPEQPQFGLDFVEAIPNLFCTFQDFHLLYIVREKIFANADNASFSTLFDTHLTGPGRSVFLYFSRWDWLLK